MKKWRFLQEVSGEHLLRWKMAVLTSVAPGIPVLAQHCTLYSILKSLYALNCAHYLPLPHCA